ncbi:peptidase M13 [Aliikangiella marina]|uniref:Peptidase M13 n=1 Tax=Aliikangiella marina TaxID=1712262 RepID=A0A545TIE3_9GAMM|nr:M13-type metalloendopeptidase [Aliikangiella marina]TQV76946.1 peptidase M13 [Aliikangiella marina]
MKRKLLASAVCFALVTACGQQDSKQAEVAADAKAESKVEAKAETKILKSGINIENMDKSVRPQDDFYKYVNGTWLKNTEIPADKSVYGTFALLADKAREDVKAIIEETSSLESVEKGSDAQKVGDLFRSYMNTEKLDQLGFEPIKPMLAKIDALKTHDDVVAYFAASQKFNADSPFGFFINNDSKDPTKYIVYMGQSGLGLPTKEHYSKTDEKSVKLREDYLAHVERMLNMAEIKTAKEDAAKIMALETALADIQWTRKESRDRNKTYNKLDMAKLAEMAPEINWQLYFSTAGINEENIIVRQPSYLEKLSGLLKETSVEDWQKYLKWNIINGAASILSSEFDQANFDFYSKTLRGTEAQEERWKRGVSTVNRLLGEVVGKIYVEKHFKPEAKARMVELVENLREAYRLAIIDLEWMGEETKKQALDKLAKFTPKIGYPDKWRDYSALEISADDLFGNFMRSAEFNYNRQVNKLGKPIDKTEWFMSPQRVNAYYNPVMNEIVFPAAILQPPFFNMEADDAVNYGGIGGVIGHEMGHGFDDQGSKSDGDGVLRNWWTEQDLAEFKKRTGKLASQYSQFEPLPGEHIDGELTLGENIGDLGGLTIAHRAYMLSLDGKEAPVIDGFSGEERFFMGWAQVWASKYRDQAMTQQLIRGPHSPATFRGNGPLMNMPEFMKALDVKPGDGMYRAPEERVKIW